MTMQNCGIFEPRESAPPDQSSSTYIPPVEPKIVFDNMIAAVREMNTVNYAKSFCDTSTSGAQFVFQPTPEVNSKYSVIFSGWNKTSEQQYFLKMAKAPKDSAPTLTLTLNQLSLQSDSAQYTATYKLVIPHLQLGVATVANGRAQFILISDRSRNWSIKYWADFPLAANDFTWSNFKALYGQ
jgi:hypothetical protein